MHPRNIFSHKKPDFSLYAHTRPSLRPHLIEQDPLSSRDGFQYTLDFSDPQSLRELTCACLEHEFGLKVEIPPDHLIPTVPLRLNYIHWIEDLLTLGNDSSLTGDKVVGIDIGCGASSIYPLLGSHLNGWKFVATEILPESIKCALENVSRNNLDEKITVLQVKPEVVLKGAVDTPPFDDHTHYSFCMCNPPFFRDGEDLMGGAPRTERRPEPQTCNTGNESETVTEGGEVEFVRRIIADSVILGTRIRWYTSMLGKKSSLVKVKSILRKENIQIITDTSFVQGKTHRWGVAWSYDLSLKKRVGSPFDQSLHRRTKRVCPYSLRLTGFPSSEEGFTKAAQWLIESLTKLKIEFEELNSSEANSRVWYCKTNSNTWSKQRKRKRLMARIKELHKSDQQEQLEAELESLNTPCYMEFKCSIEEEELIESRTAIKAAKRQDTGISSYSEPATTAATVVCTLEWIKGQSSRDELHQLTQVLQNWLTN